MEILSASFPIMPDHFSVLVRRQGMPAEHFPLTSQDVSEGSNTKDHRDG